MADIELVVEAGDDGEAVSDRLWSLGAVAVVDDGPLLRAGFVDEGAARRACDELALRWECGIRAVTHEWRRSSPPVSVGRLFVHLPEHAVPISTLPAETVAIEIEPGGAFGSGTHPTTRQCLQMIATVAAPGVRVLDVGCGTGVLAIAAARLGADVVAVDHDEIARRATVANATRNGALVEVLPAIPAGRDFDLVVCNLGGSRAVLELAPTLGPAVAAGGRVVVAGLLVGSNEVPFDVFPGLEITERHETDGWFSLVFSRRGA